MVDKPMTDRDALTGLLDEARTYVRSAEKNGVTEASELLDRIDATIGVWPKPTSRTSDLHQQIMNLPSKPKGYGERSEDWRRGYGFGHKDARHAAAELAALAVSPSLSAEQEALAASCGDVAPVARELLTRMRVEADAELVETICKRIGQPDLFGTEGERKLRAALAVSPSLSTDLGWHGETTDVSFISGKALAVSPEPPRCDAEMCICGHFHCRHSGIWKGCQTACDDCTCNVFTERVDPKALAVSGEGRTIPQDDEGTR